LAQRLLRDFEARLLEALGRRGFERIRPSYLVVFRNMHPDGSRLTDVARRAGLTKQGIGALVREMERRGLVQIVADPTDGRAKLVRLTASARRRLPEVKAVVAEIEAEYLRRIGAGQMHRVKALLRRLVGRDQRGERGARNSLRLER
jgi:DNA-binding MarR family transcriptional regulator